MAGHIDSMIRSLMIGAAPSVAEGIGTQSVKVLLVRMCLCLVGVHMSLCLVV